MTIKKRHVSFAWGQVKGGELRELATLEIVVTAGAGGKGTVWLDELAFRELPPAGPYTGTPRASASSAAARRAAAAAIDGDAATAWRPSARGPAWLAVDFGVERPLGGLVVDWNEGTPQRYDVQLSPDGAAWRTVRRVEGSNGGRDWILLPDTDTRFLRLALDGPPAHFAPGVRELTVQPLEFGASRNAFFAAVAAAAPRGTFPRYLAGKQSYWTVVGLDRDEEEGLAVFYSTNRAFSMLGLSHQYAAATTEAQKTVLLAAGQAMLSVGESHTPGTFVGLFLSELAGILISVVMLRSGIFNKDGRLFWNDRI